MSRRVPARLPAGLRPGGRFADWTGQPPGYVLCDVDGTLLHDTLEPSAAVTRAVARVQDAGVPVGIATGRMQRAAEPLRVQLGARGPHVFHDGALVHDGTSVLASWHLDPDRVDALLATVGPHDDAYVEVYTPEGYRVSADDPRASAHWEMLGSRPDGTVRSAGELGGTPVVKCTVVAFGVSAARLDELASAITRTGLRVGASHSPRTPGLQYLNVTHPETDKGRALLRAARAQGTPPERTMAVGDAPNDVPLFAVAGTAVAMGQASEEVQRAAHLIAPAAADDGVVAALDAVLELRRRTTDVSTGAGPARSANQRPRVPADPSPRDDGQPPPGTE